MEKIYIYILILLLDLIFAWQGGINQMREIDFFRNMFFLTLQIFFTYAFVEYYLSRIEERAKIPIINIMHGMLISDFDELLNSIKSLISQITNVPPISRKSELTDMESYSVTIKEIFLEKIKSTEIMKDFNYSGFDLAISKLENRLTFIIELFRYDMGKEVRENILALYQEIVDLRKNLKNDINRHENKINAFKYDNSNKGIRKIFDLIIKLSNIKNWHK